MEGEDGCRIRVVCRVRPLNAREQSTSNFVLKFPSRNTIELGNRGYTYDQVLDPSNQQPDVYSVAAKPLVNDVLSGYNATIFAYGQTASGKTHTMEGALDDPDMRGIIPRIIDDIFTHIYSMDPDLEIHIKVSYFEIYMEKIRDLLDVTKVNLPIGETKQKVPYVKGITERFVASPEEIVAVLDEGKANRRVAVTNMNAHSSRSHAVFLINIKQENKVTHKTLTGKLYLVDLAGSEKVEKTNAAGLTLDEAKTINKSLLSLSNVISALAEGNKPYIPYRDSKLTRVLQESLGGNARTTLIICCSPSSFNTSETKSTLMFGDRAKTIKNKVAVNIELTAEEWKRQYEKQKEANNKLKAILERYEAELSHWRAGESVPSSEQASRSSVSSDAGTLSSFLTPHPRVTPTPDKPRMNEEEKAKLCQQIDEKDDQILTQGEIIERLNMQIVDLEDSVSSSQTENLSLRSRLETVEEELENYEVEVHDVMKALEDLALSFDDKNKEIRDLEADHKLLLEEKEALQGTMDQKTKELNSLRDSSSNDNRKNRERLVSLFTELRDIGSTLGTKGELQVEPSNEITDDDFARVRIHLSNLRCDVRTLTQQREVLERSKHEAQERAVAIMKELTASKIRISQFEIQNENLSAHLRESDLKKRDLESVLTSLNDELLTLKTQEQVMMASELDREERRAGLAHSANEMKRTYEDEMQRHRETHSKLVGELQLEITAKEELIASMKEQYQGQVFELENVRGELTASQAKLQEEEKHMSRVRLQARVKERIQQDLGGLTDTVSRELERLNGMRQSYISHMTRRIRKSRSSESEEGLVSPDQREIKFLEKNLEELTRAHKKTASENSDLQRELPRLHTVVAVKSRRIGELETQLLETKTTASQEYERLKAEIELTKKNFQKKLTEKEKEVQHGRVLRRQGPSIVKPVPRRSSDTGSSRDALLAGAGVAVIGQRRKPRQLHTEVDYSSPGEHSHETTPLSSS